jgi:bifunctional NMN adenylyltransferase/nudix hydrolase
MTKPYNKAVFIGRVTPPHKGHIEVFNKAAEIADHVVFILGSANQPPTEKDPFTDEDRSFMVKNIFNHRFPNIKLDIYPVEDYPDNDQWYAEIQSIVNTNPEDKIALVGFLDEDTGYLNDFPQWKKVFIDADLPIHATEIRENLLTGSTLPFIAEWIPKENHEFLMNWLKSRQFVEIKHEFETNKAYKDSWKSAPYAPVFVTTDGVITQSGHVCMIQRKSAPGRNLWALPGGFLDVKQRIFDSCIREIYEETSIKVPKMILIKALTGQHVFDNPSRSLRGRTITHAYHFALHAPLDGKLPKIKAADDAGNAKWIPFSELKSMRRMIFEDHLDIIRHFVRF